MLEISDFRFQVCSLLFSTCASPAAELHGLHQGPPALWAPGWTTGRKSEEGKRMRSELAPDGGFIASLFPGGLSANLEGLPLSTSVAVITVGPRPWTLTLSMPSLGSRLFCHCLCPPGSFLRV